MYNNSVHQKSHNWTIQQIKTRQQIQVQFYPSLAIWRCTNKVNFWHCLPPYLTYMRAVFSHITTLQCPPCSTNYEAAFWCLEIYYLPRSHLSPWYPDRQPPGHTPSTWWHTSPVWHPATCGGTCHTIPASKTVWKYTFNTNYFFQFCN